MKLIFWRFFMNPLVWKIPVIILAAMVGIYLLLLGLCCFLKIAVMLQIKSAKNQLQCLKSSIDKAYIISCKDSIVLIEMQLDLNAIQEQYCHEFAEILKEDSRIISVDCSYKMNMKTMNIDIRIPQKLLICGLSYSTYTPPYTKEEILLLFKDSARGKLSSFPEKNDSIDINIFKAPFHFVYDKCSGIDPLERYTDAALVQISY